jgi:hypothetical protein
MRVPRGSTSTGCVLCLLALPIGILYLLLTSGYRIYCPNCGMLFSVED